jgi:uncharacterized protein GlcG (DUF336 family)
MKPSLAFMLFRLPKKAYADCPSMFAKAQMIRMSRMNPSKQLLGLWAIFACVTSMAQEGTFASRSLTAETALVAANAALQSCRKQGYQVAVAVVDRAGLTQVLLRDRFAGAHTVEVATNKAWTAASFRTSTTDLARETQPGMPMSGLRNLPRFLAAGGGLVIEAGGSTLGAIGVSGAPGGEADDSCAKAGIAAIRESIEF